MFDNYWDGCCSLNRATEIIYFNKKYHKTILCNMLWTFLLCALKFHSNAFLNVCNMALWLTYLNVEKANLDMHWCCCSFKIQHLNMLVEKALSRGEKQCKWDFGNFIEEPKLKCYHSLIWLCVLISIGYYKLMDDNTFASIERAHKNVFYTLLVLTSRYVQCTDDVVMQFHNTTYELVWM